MIKSKLGLEKERMIIEKINFFYEKELNKIFRYANKNNAGGKIRQAMGDLGENMSALIWTEVAKIYSDVKKPIKPKKGEKDQIECVNKNGRKFYAHVDKHCYIDKNFVLAIESKSYLDSCYYYRASNDFRLLKQYFNKNLICVVISIEDAMKEESRIFIEDEGWVNQAFILSDGKRSSARPIWKKEFKKELNLAKVKILIKFLDNIFCNKISL